MWTFFDGLNPEQRRAAEAVRGPVCILAGAGSGKTTTITRRIAHQVGSGAFRADQILAVTFTDKAAGEMRARLAALGATGVEARTFHSAALAQLHRFAPDARRRGSCRPRRCSLRQIAQLAPAALQVPAGRRPRHRDRVGQEPAHPARRATSPRSTTTSRRSRRDLMHTRLPRVRAAARRDRGEIDFEDLLELAIRHLRERRAGARATSATATAPSPSTSTRTSTCSSRRCSTSGSARATTSASSATTTSRSTPSPVRRRGSSSAMPAAVPARDGGPARGELPLDAAGARAREPARAAARRRREGAARDAAGRARAVLRPFATPARTSWRRRASRGPQLEGVPLEEIGDPLPHERAPGRLRGGAARGGHSVPGLVAPRARRGALRCSTAKLARRPPTSVPLALEAGWLEQRRRSSASAS